MQSAPNVPGSSASGVVSMLNRDALKSTDLGHSINGSVDRGLVAHEHLYLEGESQSHIYVVTAGVICTYKLLSDGRRQIYAFAYPGDILGVECVGLHLNHAEALTESVVRCIPSCEIDKLFMNEPGFGQALLRITAMDLVNTREQLLSLGRKTAAEKLATFLVNIARRTVTSDQSEVDIDLPMKRSDIADYLGLTVETVSRNFTRLKQCGEIRLLSQTRILISNIESLQALANGQDSERLQASAGRSDKNDKASVDETASNSSTVRLADTG